MTCPVHGVPTIGPVDGAVQRLEVGTVLAGQYRIDGLLGQGGMGALLSATDLRQETRVVVKVLRGERVSEIGNVRRFYQEARAARALSHPNIVRILLFGVDEATRAPFIAMEFVPGRTLKAWLADEGPMGERLTATLFVPITRALSAAHRVQVLHRDLKPSNIMVHETDGEPLVKVLDFGLAKILEDTSTAPLTQPGKTVGTPAFMSPEQVMQRPQDFRTDLYGLGCVLHAALTGHPPFVGNDLIEVMQKQMRSPAPPLPMTLTDGRPPSTALRNLHARLLAKDPHDRPGSTDAVVEAFLDLKRQFTSPTLGPGRYRFEHQDTQIDLSAAPTQASPAPGDADWDDASLLAKLGDEPTLFGRGKIPDPGPTYPLPPEALPGGRPEDTDAPTPLFHAEARAPTESQPELPDASLTSVLPSSIGEQEPDTLTPPLPLPDAPTGPAATVPRPPARQRDPRRASAFRLRTPAPSALGAPDRSLWWLAGAFTAGLGLFFGLTFLVSPAPLVPSAGPEAPNSATVRPPIRTTSAPLIEIRSVPAGAEVFLEGERVGQTPIAIDRPPPGQPQTLQVRRAGYQTATVVLRFGSTSPVEVQLVPR